MAVAKNYLNKEELEALGRLVNAYLDLAEDRARRKIPMTMQDWANRLDAFLELADRDILQGAGRISMAMAKVHAESEFEKYRIIQDQLFESDFDRLIQEQATLPSEKNKLLLLALEPCTVFDAWPTGGLHFYGSFTSDTCHTAAQPQLW